MELSKATFGKMSFRPLIFHSKLAISCSHMATTHRFSFGFWKDYLRMCGSQVKMKRKENVLKLLNITSNMRHLFVVGEFVVVSHLKIFPLELPGPAIGFSPGPSSCKGKILR